MLLSCNKNFFGIENKSLQEEAINSKEFKELKTAYSNYLKYGKNNNFTTAYKKYGYKTELSDSVKRYRMIQDSLANVMRDKSNLFYSKYTLNELDLTVEEFKALLNN